jgi:photosystem II stability/assembly factor-like uncharacterized protein
VLRVKRRKRVMVVLIAGAGVVTACGSRNPELDIPLSSLPPTTAPASTVAPITAPIDPGTGSTVPTSTTAPKPWVEAAANLVGLTSECGNVNVASRPGQDMVIASVAHHGLFSQSAGSDQWTPLGSKGGDTISNRLSSIIVDPDHPETFWETGAYGPGMYRTDDNGASFTALGDVAHIDSASIDFTDPDRKTILAGVHEKPVLMRSVDGGKTWAEVSGLPADIGYATSPYVIDANTFLLGTNSGANAGVFRSTDAGATWTKVSDKPVTGPAVVNGTKIQWLELGGAGVITTADGGVTFTEQTGGGAIDTNALYLVPLPDGRLATWSSDHVLTSTDDGARWQRIGGPLPYSPSGLAANATSGALYVSRFDCDNTGDNPVKTNSFMRLDPGA